MTVFEMYEVIVFEVKNEFIFSLIYNLINYLYLKLTFCIADLESLCVL